MTGHFERLCVKGEVCPLEHQWTDSDSIGKSTDLFRYSNVNG